METTLVIKNIFLPKLEKDPKFSEKKVDFAFWEKFATDLVHFEEDAKPLYTGIYSLELDNPEKIIDKLPNIYAQFLKELAESYVLDKTSDVTNYLLETNNAVFLKEVQFLKSMQQAIKSVERKRIKTDLPKSYERLTFELSDADLANATKKKGREDLKEKMKKWDNELEKEKRPLIYYSLKNESINKTKSKVISSSWIKYAVAACVVLATGIFYFKNTNSTIIPVENSVVTTDDKKETPAKETKPLINEAIVFAPIETTSKSVTILQPESLGFTSDKKARIKVTFKDASQRIASLEKYIETNPAVDSKILNQHKSELATLKTLKEKYLFDGKVLTLFAKISTKDYSILLTENQLYYLKKGTQYYHLKISKIVLPLQKVTEAETIEILEKITF